MAALKENLLSPWHLTDTKALRTLTKRGQTLKKSEHRRMELHGNLSTLQTDQHLRAERLQWRWQEMKERERKARQHNRQLLQEFEKAQDTLREMVTRTAAMNTIRMEYERYLEESTPRWQQQLEEKTLSAQRKRMEEYLKECLKRIEEEQVTRCSAEAHPAPSQGNTKQPQKAAAPQEYNHHGSIQSSWLTHTHSPLASFPSRMPCHPQGSSHIPPSFHPPPVFPQLHPFQPHHLSSTPSHRLAAPQQGPPGWAALQTDYPYSRAAGVAGFPSGRGSGSSQELDIKPVRLSSGHGESNESGRDSSQASRSNKSQERRWKRREEKRGRTACCSSDREEGNSLESPRISSAVVASASVGQGSESRSSSEIGSGSSSSSSRRSGGLSVKPQRMKQQLKERIRSKGDDSQSQLEESRSQIMENQSPGDKSDSCREETGSQRDESGSHTEESGSASVKIEDGSAEETEEQESSSAEQSSEAKRNQGEGHDEETHRNVEQVDVEENEDSSRRKEEEEDRGAEDEESMRKNTTEEEEGEMEEQESVCQGEGRGQSDREESENELEGSATSQDGEMEEEGSDEEEGGREEEEERRSDEAGEPEEKDSEDSIILPQHRPVKIHSIPEDDAIGDEEESKREYADDSSDEFEEDDGIERLLAPQKPETQNKEEKDPNADGKAKGSAGLDNFSVELDRKTKAAHDTDSDEFDHFYD